MEDADILYKDEGYYYKNGKIPGRPMALVVAHGALHLYRSGIAGKIGKGLGGAVGAAAGTLLDNTTGANGPMPEVSIPYTSVSAMAIKKSFASGAGILFTLNDGTVFKYSGPKMSFGGVKKIYPSIAGAIKTANPSVILDPGI